MTGEVILIGLVGMVLGFILSVLVNKYKTQGSSEKLKELEKEYKDYRQKVDAHFVNTGVLFKGLTEQYRDVYQHISTGANTLCSDEAKALQVKMDEPTLLTTGLDSKGLDDEKPEPEMASETPDSSADKTAGENAPQTSVDEHDADADADALSEGSAFANEVELPTDIADEIQVQSLNKK